jgi:hypothetical protein
MTVDMGKGLQVRFEPGLRSSLFGSPFRDPHLCSGGGARETQSASDYLTPAKSLGMEGRDGKKKKRAAIDDRAGQYHC